MAKQKGSKKHGRSKRTPSNKMQEFRTARNKRLKQERHAKQVAAKTAAPARRGRARFLRRKLKQRAYAEAQQQAA